MVLVYKQIEITAALAANEKAVGDLYREYANLFPDYSDFWTSIAKEEDEHSLWVKRLQKQVEDGSLYFKEDRFNIEAIKLFYEKTLGKIEEAKKGKITIQEALSMASDLEGSLIERKFFEIFEHDSVEFKNTLQSLAASTASHQQRVKEQLDKL